MFKKSKLSLGLSTLIASTFLLAACGFSGPTSNVKGEVDFNNTTLLTPKTAKFIEDLRAKGEEVFVSSVAQKGQKTDNYLHIRINNGKQSNQFRIQDSLDAITGVGRTGAADLDAFELYLIDSNGAPPGPVHPIAQGPFTVPAAPLGGGTVQSVVFTDVPDSTDDYYAAAAALKGPFPGGPYANITALGATGKMEDGQRVFVSASGTDVTAGAVGNPAPLMINMNLLDEHNAFIETAITVNDGGAFGPGTPGAF